CPEHYYYTLVEAASRFNPHFLVVGLYSNDFGEDVNVLKGDGDWTEEKFWLLRIVWYCRGHGITCLFAPVPCEGQLVGLRNSGNYPGQASNLSQLPGRLFLDTTDVFVDEDLKVRTPWNPGGGRLHGRSHLYNGDLGDGHLSPAGAALWGRNVARRLALLLSKE